MLDGVCLFTFIYLYISLIYKNSFNSFLFKTSSTLFAVGETTGNLPCSCSTESTPVAYIIQNTPNSKDSALLQNVTAKNCTRIATPLLSTVCWSDRSVHEHSCIHGNDYADSDTSSRLGSLGLLKSL